jgi:glycosyltransferase involved in cell wall biosynthesis
MPKVSVIIPAYNHAPFVGPAIRSVLSQTYQDFEIIITDDGSRDKTVEVIQGIKDQRIMLFCFSKNRGTALAVQNCLDHSRGEYIALLNSDDIFLPKKLENQVAFLDAHPDTDAVFTRFQFIDAAGKDIRDRGHLYFQAFDPSNRSRQEWLRFFFYYGNCLCHSSVLARREVYTVLSKPDPRLAQLGDFKRWILICLSREIFILPEKLVKFRILDDYANASAPRPEVFIRTNYELRRILRYFLCLHTLEDFLKVFPEAEAFPSPLEQELIPYYLARLALKVRSLIYRDFALETLFNLLKDKAIAEKLEQQCNFSFRDFIQLTGEKPPWFSAIRFFAGPFLNRNRMYRFFRSFLR